MPEKCVLAYSGGLDTSVILRWLIEEYGCEDARATLIDGVWHITYVAVSRVGIDRNGADYPSSTSDVVWSGTATPHDTWQALSVSAVVGPSGKVTVILYTSYRGYSRRVMTASWDDATLEVISFGSHLYLPLIGVGTP